MKETKTFNSITGHRLKTENALESQNTLTGKSRKSWHESLIRHKSKRLKEKFVSF